MENENENGELKIELKPCPKCKGQEISIYFVDDDVEPNKWRHYHVECLRCGYTMCSSEDSKELAAAEWNRRAE